MNTELPASAHSSEIGTRKVRCCPVVTILDAIRLCNQSTWHASLNNLSNNNQIAGFVRASRLFQRIFQGFFQFGHPLCGRDGSNLVPPGFRHQSQSGDELKRLIGSGHPVPGPTPLLSDTQLYDIVDYLHRRIDEIDFYPQIGRVAEGQMLSSGDANIGRSYFNGAGGCSGCHSPTGDLKGIADRYDPLTLELRFISPVAKATITVLVSGQKFKGELLGVNGINVSMRAEDGQKHTWRRDTVKVDLQPEVTVTLKSGQQFKGRLVALDSFDVPIEDDDGWNHSWQHDAVKIDVLDTLVAHRECIRKYSDADIHNMLAFLETLK